MQLWNGLHKIPVDTLRHHIEQQSSHLRKLEPVAGQLIKTLGKWEIFLNIYTYYKNFILILNMNVHLFSICGYLKAFL